MGAAVTELAKGCICDPAKDEYASSGINHPVFDVFGSEEQDTKENQVISAVIPPLEPETELATERHFKNYGNPSSMEGSTPKEIHENVQALCPPGCFVRLHSTGLSDLYCMRPRSIGWGTFGDVALAVHTGTGARRAVKTINKTWLRRAYLHMQEREVNTFVRREVEVLKTLDHPNIVRLHEAFDDHNDFQVVLELCEGGTLASRIECQQEHLPESEAVDVFRQMLAAVQHLHSHGFIHRDLKPDNFMFSKMCLETGAFSHEAMCLKLIDFGLARRLGLDSGLHNGKFGTKNFMAPEVVGGYTILELSDRIDIWALGVILFIVLVFELPSVDTFEKITDQSTITGTPLERISPIGVDLLSQLLSKEPLLRPTALMAMRHSWCNCDPKFQLNLCTAAGFEIAVNEYVLSLKLRRLALLFLAYVADDHNLEFASARRYFQAFEFESEGAISRASLRMLRNAGGPLSIMAGTMHERFDELDIDGAETITWTKFLAIFIEVSGRISNDSSERDLGAPRIVVSEDICRHAFYLLSDCTDKISAITIGELFAPVNSGRVLSYETQAGTSNKFQGLAQSMARDEMVREVDSKGFLDFDGFLSMLCNPRERFSGVEHTPLTASLAVPEDTSPRASSTGLEDAFPSAISCELDTTSQLASSLDGEYLPVRKMIATKAFTISGNQWIFADTGNVYTITEKTETCVRRTGYNGLYNYTNGRLIRDDGFEWIKARN